MKRTVITCAICLTSLASAYSGGSGTPEDPFEIASVQDLIDLGNEPNDYDKHFVLVADIDMDPNLPEGKVFDRAVIAPDTDSSYNFQGARFSGTFDGQGYAIWNLHIQGDDENDYIGLFGLSDKRAVLTNLGIKAAHIKGAGRYVGAMIGENQGRITSCYSTGTVSGDNHVGGMVGANRKGTITLSYSASAVNGNIWIGGLAGYNEGSLNLCYCMGIATADQVVGGLVGLNYRGLVSSSFCTGEVSGNDKAGGFVGQNMSGVIISCFWDTETSEQSNSDGGMGLTTVQMQTFNTFLNAGWDFLGERANGLHEYWRMPAEGGYPVLSIFDGFVPRDLQGAGTAEDPYLLETAEDLATVWYRPTASYRLISDIDLFGVKWGMAVIPTFSGRLDGRSHRIVGLNLAGQENLGFIGYLAQGAAVFDLGLENVTVFGTSACIGGLVGTNDGGTISACYSTGLVSGYRSIGGLVGENYEGTISSSFSSCSVSGNWEVGGLVGDNDDTVSACYGMGSVRGGDEVGGLVGINHGTISACYSTRPVDGVYWVGGLVGSNVGTISACHSTGWINGNGGVGGLVGYNGSTISGCYSTGSISGNGAVGGLVGSNGDRGTISACYSTGSVNCPYNAGGLAGYSNGAISACYSTGSVSGEDNAGGLVGYNGYDTISACYSTGRVSGYEDVGGLVGKNQNGSISACFWDIQTSHRVTSDGGKGLTTAQMKMVNTFLNAGWDFIDETVNGAEDIWWMPGSDYPMLWWQEP